MPKTRHLKTINMALTVIAGCDIFDSDIAQSEAEVTTDAENRPRPEQAADSAGE